DETEVATIPDAEAEGEKKFKKLKPITVPPEQQGIPYRLAPDPHVDKAEASHEAIGDTRTMAELDQQQELVMDPPPDPPPPASAGLPSPRITHKQHIDLECAIRELADASGADADAVREWLKKRMRERLEVPHFPQLNQDQLTVVNGWLNDAWRKPR